VDGFSVAGGRNMDGFPKVGALPWQRSDEFCGA
jgi:hypothetical protein